jgi:hypothetical protein
MAAETGPSRASSVRIDSDCSWVATSSPIGGSRRRWRKNAGRLTTSEPQHRHRGLHPAHDGPLLASVAVSTRWLGSAWIEARLESSSAPPCEERDHIVDLVGSGLLQTWQKRRSRSRTRVRLACSAEPLSRTCSLRLDVVQVSACARDSDSRRWSSAGDAGSKERHSSLSGSGGCCASAQRPVLVRVASQERNRQLTRSGLLPARRC